ncbi:glycoside hydrolase family 30 protein [bacterium]|nr:glycoside hydrolase family 30 protein [bacterium]
MAGMCLALAAAFGAGCRVEDDTPSPSGRDRVAVYTTESGSAKRLHLSGPEPFSQARQPFEYEIAVFVNPCKQFQTFLGIGGAITDVSAEVFAALSPEQQQEVLRAYFDPEHGIGYTLVRVPIHSCDFSSASYTYVEEGDSALTTFSIAHDREYRIPMIRRAMETAGGSLTLYASPWSPPAFMKSNNSMLQGGSLLPEWYQPWANYYVKFIRAYEDEGIPVWGLTLQNEPMATQRWESCIYTAEEERDFLRDYLGPTLKREGLGDRKIIVWDHNRDLIVHRANTILSDPEAAQYVWGIGFHWYETWAGGEPMFDNLTAVWEAFPDKQLIFTEGCAESFTPGHYQSWKNAERYGRSMISDFNRGTVGWTDWNILLDERGGPNHVGNYCFAPMHADLPAGRLHYTLAYYYIGHFSKFIRPGARRVSTAPSRSHLLATSFLNTDGSLATVVMNRSDEAIRYMLTVEERQAVFTIQPHAIQTLVY